MSLTTHTEVNSTTLIWTFRTDAQQLTGYATGQPDTQPDDRLCNRMVTCACSCTNKVSHSLIHVLHARWMRSKNTFLLLFQKTLREERSAVIHQRFGERITHFLKNPLSIEDRNFRHLVKKSGFQLLDLPEAGIRDALVVQDKGEKEVIRSGLVFIFL